MARRPLARRIVALAAAYAIALQALFSALAVPQSAFAGSLCLGLGHPAGGAPSGSDHDCPACPPSCAGTAAGLPAEVATTPGPCSGAADPLAIRQPVPSGAVGHSVSWARAPPR